ncbi:MAG: sporulation protein [Clostridiales bacterium]|nr:sporulation protein [Clostridiales bacterium]
MKKRIWQALGLLGVMALLLVRSAVAGEAVRRGLTLCARSVVPALFPYFVVSGLFTSLGFAEGVGRRLAPVTEHLFGVGGAGASALFLGLLGGYPVGGRTAGQLYRAGRLEKDEAQRLLAFCNNAGPSFILGVVGLGCFQSLRAGVLLYVIHALSAVLVGVLQKKKGRPRRSAPRPLSPPEKILPAFIRSVQDSAGTMVRICGFVVFALVVQALLAELTGITHPAALGFIELTGGVVRLGSGPSDFVWAAALLGWGGLSVHGQTASVLAGTGLNMGRYFCGKLLQAAFSAVLAYMAVRFFA